MFEKQLCSTLIMQISVRSGGHDYVCANLKNNSIHFDLRLLNKVQFVDQTGLPKEVLMNKVWQL